MYDKKGQTKKSGASLMAEAISTFKEIANAPIPLPPTPDSLDAFCVFVGSRLRNMPAEQRKNVEDKIMETSYGELQAFGVGQSNA